MTALHAVQTGLNQPKTRAATTRFLAQHGDTLLQTIEQEMITIKEASLIDAYLDACATITPLLTTIATTMIPNATQRTRIKHRQTDCTTEKRHAILQWQKHITESPNQPRFSLALFKKIHTYQPATSAELTHIAHLKTQAKQSIWLAPITWLGTEEITPITPTLNTRHAIHDTITRHLHHQKSEHIDLRNTPSANNTVRIQLHISETTTISTPTLHEDTLRYSKTTYGQTNWYDHPFRYFVHERHYAIHTTGTVWIYRAGHPIDSFTIDEEASHTIEIGEATLDRPLQYRDIHFPPNYHFHINQSIHIDRQPSIAKLMDAISTTIATHILKTVDRD